MAKTKKLVQFTPTEIKDELLKKYPPKVARKRAKQIMINEAQENETPSEIVANVRTIPGIITMRGCTYAGCKGVILGPTRDLVNITHGPIGCGFYSWLTRRNQTDPGPDGENYMPYCFSTDMQDQDIIFGGEKKLAAAIQEAYDLFHPKGIAIFATCPVGLIGDDIHAVAKKMKAKFGDCNVFAFSCEGYKGVSQSAGHHIANNQVFTHLVGENEKPKEGEFKINLLGEYNIGGDGFEIDRIFKLCGITNIATFSGNSSYDQFASAQHADLNTVMCHRSINYVADMLETKYGIPWIKVNFIGANATAKSLRKIAEYFGDKKLIDRVEAVIAEEMPEVEAVAADVRTRTEGKTAMMFVGGSRAHHYGELFSEMGMKTISAGYEFGHRDDYEGRQVIPNLKVDADSRNIEEIEVVADDKYYNPRKTPGEMQALEESGLKFKHYDGMNPDMDKGTIIVDDLNQYEAEKLVELLKPDVFCAGIKEKYSIQKLGVPMKQLHSYDSGGPYAGFKGAVNFYQEIDRLVNSKVWSYMKAPWQENPELTATFVWE
ncbi:MULTISPECIES: nitrogenase molybdenum-iron protein alpha chain [unclassified Pseudodesulfovibrio]|uniref:nitrogenase molybdenum-iron protein alpha chain n=1 Tax=unclassified Pseudodesulfovibrio TaxID=2661612 RepID=UPI000FEC0F78|nr:MULTISPECIES: nitrogenase molybdenum-iron protein alpha chain [unclassified Pseudodesulfovibrio]MCJ2163481.1 nitrogenase molybdenum-iron protein alpha chain [Pseudodesulfovibrio sp. S3-i]RWU06716.1 nitrogenase molybdenum-iron protein alpha chain [Pseudodesulfovibrio sp. S3]